MLHWSGRRSAPFASLALSQIALSPITRSPITTEDSIMAIAQKLLVGGELVDSAHQLDIINPATGDVFARVPRASRDDAERAIAAAKAAQPAWAATPLAERRTLLLKLADAVEANADELA